MALRLMNMSEARRFVVQYHYAHDWGSIGKLSLGIDVDDKLMGVAIWGYGTRPLHTIKKCFPSLDTKDYLELNRLCLLDEMPRNSESQFISDNAKYIKTNLPQIKVLYSWADGLRGKPGYVYQSASWLYGGHIWSEYYMTQDGQVVHPRLLISRDGTRTKAHTQSLNLTKVHGYQFRYCKFLCNHKEQKRLLKESPFKWTQDYPKSNDLKFVIDAEEGSRESREIPILKGSGQFRNSAPNNQYNFMELVN